MSASKRSGSTTPGGIDVYASSWALTAGGLALIGVGLYFLFIRPPLLPEDLRYMGTTLEHVRAIVPGLLNWLPKVFAVLGGYIISTGVLTCYLAWTCLRVRSSGALAIAWLSGATSIGLMVAVNFVIRSDFRWVLLLLGLPWIATTFLYWEEATWTAIRKT
jgi:hypothetical protein